MNPVIQKALDAKLGQLGIDWLKVDSLVIRSADKSVFATVSLDGEAEPVELTVLYKLEGDQLVVENVEASKPWMSKALQLALDTKGSSFTLPTGMAGMAIRMLL
ncbi:MAG: hypothetical protein KDN22_16055 [Verrucomicrobiae bacterium]|nr:hypothetical protein [Verrucomicrobiae bacterium]